MQMTHYKNDTTSEPRWGIRLERDPRPERSARQTAPKRDRLRGFRVFVMSTFILHAIAYAAIILMLAVINFLTWDGELWAVFPAIGWGAFLAMHGGVAWLTSNVGVSSRMVDRAQGPSPIAAAKAKSHAKANPAEAELAQIVQDGLSKVDEMRAIGRNMRTPVARRNALTSVSSIENTLLALETRVDELPLARDFSGSFIQPAHRIFVEYNRLAGREIQSAQALLEEVEQKDLPRITERAEQVYDRVHRGTVIDLEVAREMLNLGPTA